MFRQSSVLGTVTLVTGELISLTWYIMYIQSSVLLCSTIPAIQEWVMEHDYISTHSTATIVCRHNWLLCENDNAKMYSL